MAYIRWGQKTTEGKYSSSFVIGDPNGLINFNKGDRIPYEELRKLLNTETDDSIRAKLKQRLELREDELEVVCGLLFEERNQGRWEI